MFMGMTLAGTENGYWSLARVGGGVRSTDDDGGTAIRNQTAIQQP